LAGRVLQGVGAALGLLSVAFAFTLGAPLTEGRAGVLGWFVVWPTLILLASLVGLTFLVAHGLLVRRGWGIGAAVAYCLSLCLFVPIGSVVGGYVLWLLFKGRR